MSISRINSIILGHANIFQKFPWKNDIHYTNSYRDIVEGDLPKHNDCLQSAYKNILAFLKSVEPRGVTECRAICKDIIAGDPQNINAHLQLYDISSSKEDKANLKKTVEDILKSVSRDHCIGVALMELGIALSTLIPKFYEETEESSTEKLDAFFEKFDCLSFHSDVRNLDIAWRDEIEDTGLFNHEAKNAYRWYNAVIYQKEGLKRLSESHMVSSSDFGVYRFSLAQASNRLSHELLSCGGAEYQRDHYSMSSMKGFCEVIYSLNHYTHSLYVSRAFAYLGIMIQKKRMFQNSPQSTIDMNPPEYFQRLADLEEIWKDPENAYRIAVSRFEPDIVVFTRYGKYLVNEQRYDEALDQLKKTEDFTLRDKWFPNYAKMLAYCKKYEQEREKNPPDKEMMSFLLEKATEYGEICKRGNATSETLYYYAKALYWAGTEFPTPYEVHLKDRKKVIDALDTIEMIYKEYRNQDLTRVYKLHADCSKVLDHHQDALNDMILSFSSSRISDDEVLPSFKYLWKYGCILCHETTDGLVKKYALRQIKFAIEHEIKYCHSLIQNLDMRHLSIPEKDICRDLLNEQISTKIVTSLKDLNGFVRMHSVFVEVKKMCRKYPEQVKLLLEYIHDLFLYSRGSKTLITLGLIYLGGIDKEWTRRYNRRYPRDVNLGVERNIKMFFRPTNFLPDENKESVNKTLMYDFCVIHSPHEQEWVGCYLRPELEEGPEKFKGFIFERQYQTDIQEDDLLMKALEHSLNIIVILSKYFVDVTAKKPESASLMRELRQRKSQVICISVESPIYCDDMRWLLDDSLDGYSRPVNWKKLRGRILEGHSGNYSSTLQSMKRLQLEGVQDLPSYKMEARPRGIALIINNISFENEEGKKRFGPREGATIDTERLQKLWTSLHFEIELKRNLTKNEMLETLTSLSDVDHEKYDCLVVCIMSHGDLGIVYGSDGTPVEINDIVAKFHATNCKSLCGKPKVFFIQACQGPNRLQGAELGSDSGNGEESPGATQQSEARKSVIIPDKSDILIGQSTTPGDVSLRYMGQNRGSIYIDVLVRLIEKFRKNHDLLSILTAVNDEVSKINLNDRKKDKVYKQVPNPQHTLTKKIYFT